MPRPIALDLARTMIGLLRSTPRGIDRVEFGYAQEFLGKWPGDVFMILPTPWGVRCFERERGMQLIGLAEKLWKESARPPGSAATGVEAWVAGQGRKPTPSRRGRSAFGGAARPLWRLFSDVGISAGKDPASTIPQGAVYLNVGQSGLAVTPLLSWLRRRADVKPAFMLHDVIPLEFPEYVPPFEVRQFRKIVANAAGFAAGLITTTEAAGRSVRSAVRDAGRESIAQISIPLPASDRFLDGADSTAAPPCPTPAYFVCCGSIEPRKNHLLLLHVWRALAERHGPETPKLVLVGSRWRAGDAVTAMLDRCAALSDCVCEAPGLPTPVLRRLLAGARASLMPSFAEGFGLPIAEGLAVGTPVIASDLGAHREAGGPYATYISPLDGGAWLAAIERLLVEEIANEERARLGSYRALRWSDYFARLKPFLEGL